MADETATGRRNRPRYTLADVRGSVHSIDSWWTRYFIDPVALRLTWVFANFTRLSPNAVTLMTLPIIFVSAFFFLRGTRVDLVIGALVYEFNFALDCVDGKLARLKNRTSKLGAFSDLYLDNWNVVINLSALVWGQYLRTGDTNLIVAAWAYLVLHLLSLLLKYIAQDALGKDFKKQFYTQDGDTAGPGLLGRLRLFFSRRGLNMVLFTTVEGEAVVFFFGPLSGYVFEAIVAAALLVSVFFILKSILYLRSCGRADADS
jgi:phosphatidylglycerophosphate synthase